MITAAILTSFSEIIQMILYKKEPLVLTAILTSFSEIIGLIEFINYYEDCHTN